MARKPSDPFHELPKVELHRHLEGSLRVQTLLDITREHDLDLPRNASKMSTLVQVMDGEPLTFQNFLSKFTTLRLFYRSPEIIRRVTAEAVEDAASDNIRYLELRFTPVALSRAQGFPMGEVIDWVCASASDAAQKSGIQVRLIASVNRHEAVSLAEEVAALAADRRDAGIVGLDLAGNEAEFSAEPFADIFCEARQAGLGITVHAGEWAGAQSVHAALEHLQAQRIGHGVRIVEDASAVALAREQGTAFEVCVTSNLQTGSISSLDAHPLNRMVSAGLHVTLGTDDPGISRISLTGEYRQAVESMGMGLPALEQSILTAAGSAFLPAQDRIQLVEQIRQELKS